jgi:hypothetical protein
MNLIQYTVKNVANTLKLFGFHESYQLNNGFNLDRYSPMEYGIINCIPLSLIFVLFRYKFQTLFSKIISTNSYSLKLKFSESLYKLLYYSLTFYTICNILLYEEHIYPDINNCWVNLLEGQPRSLIVSSYYIFELSYYISELLCMSWLETKRKDHIVLYIHHIVTITLLILSYVSGFHRIGILVLYSHNINDIFLEAAKVCKYMGLEVLANINFAFLIISWILSRLYFLPFYVVRSAIYDTEEILFNNPEYTISYRVANGCLIALCAMHIYWFFLLCKIAFNALHNGETKDDRED